MNIFKKILNKLFCCMKSDVKDIYDEITQQDSVI